LYQSIVGHLTFGLTSCDALDVNSSVRSQIFWTSEKLMEKLHQ